MKNMSNLSIEVYVPDTFQYNSILELWWYNWTREFCLTDNVIALSIIPEDK